MASTVTDTGDRAPTPSGRASREALGKAIVQTVAYSDIFDYPLTATEIHRYLIGPAVSRETVQSHLAGEALVPELLAERDGYFSLPGREAIIATRRERARRAEALWSRALVFGRIIASFPFVRMVAITGELAMDNVRPASDIDYFVVTEHHRLWLCRGMILALVRLAARRHVAICPNYLLSEQALALHDRDLYAAHEVAQMVPIAGHDTYARFRRLNAWTFDYLPNAVGSPRERRATPHARPVRAVAESALRSPAGGLVERWERERKVRKLSRSAPPGGEASFASDWCKGHYHNHGQLVLHAFNARTGICEEARP